MARFQNYSPTFDADTQVNGVVINNSFYRSPKINMETLFGYSVHAEWAGTGITVDLKLQASNKDNPDEATDADWVDISGSDINSGGSDNTLYNVTDTMYRWTRLWVQETGGANATVQVFITEKGT